MSEALAVRIEWLDAPSVTTPELAASWARYETWVEGRCVTQVETTDGTFRRSVYGSLYPLAEWIASNWWMLTSHVRPSAVEARYWTWPNVRTYPWLRFHNFRGAGDGMSWPDLTLVPEGAVTCVRWAPDVDRPLGSLRFAASGIALVQSAELMQGLAELVDHVLERLAEEGLPKTRLAEDWEAIARTDEEEREFCRTVAQLGIDPYSVNDQTVASVLEVANTLAPELRTDFFDSVDPTVIDEAAEWTRRAVATASRASAKAVREVSELYEAATLTEEDKLGGGAGRPWLAGFAMARRVRRELRVQSTDRFDTSPWIGVSQVMAPSGGVQGVASVLEKRCGLVLSGGARPGTSSSVFGRARALGRVLACPQQRSFLLSSARTYDERVAGAFAAELLAPAEGIRESLNSIGEHNDAAIDAIAQHFGVSPLVIYHQYESQIAQSADGV